MLRCDCELLWEALGIERWCIKSKETERENLDNREPGTFTVLLLAKAELWPLRESELAFN